MDVHVATGSTEGIRLYKSAARKRIRRPRAGSMEQTHRDNEPD